GIDRPDRAAARAGQARGFGQEVDDAGISGLSRGRQALQVAEAPSAHAVQHDAGAIPRQMGPAGRLSDGGAELCGGAVATRQEDGTRPAAAETEVEVRHCEPTGRANARPMTGSAKQSISPRK